MAFSVCLRQISFFSFSPLAAPMSRQASVLQAIEHTTGASLSIINNTEVNNLPSARHSTQIHLLPRKQARSDAKVNDSIQEQLNLPSNSERKPLAIVARGSVKS
jgi:hypothetical protein